MSMYLTGIPGGGIDMGAIWSSMSVLETGIKLRVSQGQGYIRVRLG